MMKSPHLLLFLVLFIITACSGTDYSDLDEFIQNSGKDLRGKVDPLPEVKPYQYFTYEAFDIPNPFMPRKKDPTQHVDSGLQPDLKRRKELLEDFPLENLKMVGSLQQGEAVYALIKSSDGPLHRVKVGNYLGQNFGKINHISEYTVTLREIVQEGTNEWTERISTLMLEDQRQKSGAN
ncbi:type IV pilus assembly protein PilP [Nitrosomonas cryotolerans]|uniref:Type IV pilus assembly protein PilP n=1 Tax=Nitrosomonas cryotolerans ATCC 49181 TaxID=1131553 RepID=A0A1N6HLD7_9PROT|nr:pilus assembly protein PilP [Nitrosomonas cryotolerans]SFP64345.1 type IV pilus assembly protein PilP [Nitrosomonas cryotolerans]SIO20658.1 type IV pilus assembly protein PilP [Nitrosomonas cryotolerans ATCC 49181]